MRFLVYICMFACLCASPAGAAVRIKDITSLRGLGDNQLVGYGLVIGLQGTGDTLRNVPFTEQALQSMLNRMGLNMSGSNLRNRNVAAVIVTADLSPGTPAGARLDVTVSALGDAPSLLGGTLILTQLTGTDGTVYATAQGAVAVTGFGATGQAETLSQGVPTAGRIANGAIIVRGSPDALNSDRLTLDLKNPDYATAIRIVDAINAYSESRFRRRTAFAMGARSVGLLRPAGMTETRYLAELGELLVEPDTVARVVIDARTGTVVIGQDVQISTVGVTHGTLTVRVTETPVASQPSPFSKGQTAIMPSTAIQASQDGGEVRIVAGSSLRTLVNGLNRLGVKPSGIIAILQSIKAAGALQAELVVQ